MPAMITFVHRETFEVLTMEARVSWEYRRNSSWLVDPPGLAPLLAGGVPKHYWKVVNGDLAEMTAPEKTAAFPGIKDARNEEFSVQTLHFISDAGYDQPAQGFLTALLADAYGTGKANRAAYITQALNWIGQARGLYAVARDAVNAATNDTELNAVTLDLTPLTATDPHVTVEGALAIPN